MTGTILKRPSSKQGLLVLACAIVLSMMAVANQPEGDTQSLPKASEDDIVGTITINEQTVQQLPPSHTTQTPEQIQQTQQPNLVVNNVTTKIDIQVTTPEPTQASSNIEYLLAQIWHLQDTMWEFASTVTLWFLFQCSVVCFCLNYVLQPFLLFLGQHLRAFCKPARFNYQHVVITGGGTGLGKTLVQGIFTKGAIVTMVGKDEHKLEQLARELDPGLSSIHLINYVVADLSELSSREVDHIIQKIEKRYGQIDMVICCAAVSKPAMFLSSDISSFHHHMDLNFYAVLNFVHPIAKKMVARGQGGRIALIGDPTVTEKTIPGMAAYACSKGAIEQLAFQLKAELETYHIKVHYFLPPLMDTPMLKQQQAFYILPTKTLLLNKQLISPEAAAELFFYGISMDQFIIAGSWSIEFFASLKGCFNLIYCILLSPIGLLMRKYSERKVYHTMKTYQPFRMPMQTRSLSMQRADSGMINMRQQFQQQHQVHPMNMNHHLRDAVNTSSE